MAIDLAHETLMTLATAARTLPGGRVHVSTIHRWRMRGIRGIRLETLLRGGTRYTTKEAVARFFDATTAAGNGEPAPKLTPKQQEAAIRAAESVLSKAGI